MAQVARRQGIPSSLGIVLPCKELHFETLDFVEGLRSLRFPEHCAAMLPKGTGDSLNNVAAMLSLWHWLDGIHWEGRTRLRLKVEFTLL